MIFNDFEELYMIRQGSDDALRALYQRFEGMLWKRGLDFYNDYKPNGTQTEDLRQEGLIGLHDAVYAFREELFVGFAWFVSVCVGSRVRTRLRKCRSGGHTILDYSVSFERNISEDETLSVADVVPCTYPEFNPTHYAYVYEADLKASAIAKNELTELEVEVFKKRYRGYSYAEIALELGITVKQVDNILQKIGRILKKES